MNVDKDGMMRKMCAQQGYVPEKCTMDGFQIMALVNGGDNPCEGCNEDRAKCGGQPVRERKWGRARLMG